MAGKNEDCAKTIVIGDHEYGTLWLDPLLVVQDATVIADLLGSGFGATVGSEKALTSALGGLGAQLGSPKVIQIIEHLMAVARVEGRSLAGQAWRTHFRGKGRELVDVIAWLMEVHFADFFGGVLSKVKEKLLSAASNAS